MEVNKYILAEIEWTGDRDEDNAIWNQIVAHNGLTDYGEVHSGALFEDEALFEEIAERDFVTSWRHVYGTDNYSVEMAAETHERLDREADFVWLDTNYVWYLWNYSEDALKAFKAADDERVKARLTELADCYWDEFGEGKLNTEWSQTAYEDLPRDVRESITWADFHRDLQFVLTDRVEALNLIPVEDDGAIRAYLPYQIQEDFNG